MKKSTKTRTTKQRSCLPVIVITILITVVLIAAAGELNERRLMHMYPQKYSEYVELYAEKYNVPTEIVYAVIHTESGFDPVAVSSAGAVGLMQITPDTYDWLLYIRKEEKVSELTDPVISIDFGTYFLSYLYNKFGDWSTAFAAYNAGMNRVSEWLEDTRYTKNGVLEYIPYVETRNYVNKVNNTLIKYEQIYQNH
ncbi:MAG: lytic transglycosylase domain-containing protein [Clostridia bacterium]|nr:lytic transglycosylase domain-containing protein [Clostridia bacterium]